MELNVDDFIVNEASLPNKVLLLGNYENWEIVSRMQKKVKKTYRDGSYVLIKCSDCGCLKVVHVDSYTRGLKKHICIPRFENGNRTRLYEIYTGMNRRCYKEEHKDYKNYGMLGITICKEWLDSYNCFHNWAIGNGYSDCLSIDRIDPRGNYSPENCRWATAKEQARNKKNTLFYVVNGVKESLPDICDRYNVYYPTVIRKLYAGKSILEVLKELSSETIENTNVTPVGE